MVRRTKKPELASVVEEMEYLRTSDPAGVLRAEALVAFAADPDTHAHAHFTWDDSVAGHQYRLWQARTLIRTRLTIHPACNRSMRVYVSLGEDRSTTGGGYRAMVDVMDDDARRAALLAEARRDAERFMDRYTSLEEFAETIAAMRRALGRRRRKRKRKRKRT